MAIKIDCPRCKKLLQVPRKLAGGYVTCPHCKGRLWVSKDAPAEATPSAPMPSPPLVAPPLAAPLAANSSSGPWAVIRSTSDSAALPSVAPPLVASGSPLPPPPPPPGKKVARFIAAEPVDSTLRLAADGKLPELHLDDGTTGQREQAKPQSMNPLVLFGVLSASILLSITLVWIGMARPDGANSERKREARGAIEREYLGAGRNGGKGLERYQIVLRDAISAYSRGDYKTEREGYRFVLKLLRAERETREKGLTGSRRRDKQLEDALTVLVGGG